MACELARRVAVERLRLVSAGFRPSVSPAVLDRIAAGGPDHGVHGELHGEVARPDDRDLVELIQRDFEVRGPDVLLQHMRAFAHHRPHVVRDPPPTTVLWGTRDPGVSLDDHAELTARYGGLLVPIANAGHLPYLEQADTSVLWIRRSPLQHLN